MKNILQVPLGQLRIHLPKALLGMLIVLSISGVDAFAQPKFFSTPTRSGGESAKGMAMIHTLLEENVQRKQEIEGLDGRLGTAEGQISALQAEMADIEPHAKAALSACGASGKVLQWSGGAWVCADEADPTVGPHALVTKTPPFCHEVNAKLIWSPDAGGSWKCVTDQTGDTSPYITAETDPTIQSVASGRLCYGTGSKIACDSAAPTLSSGTLGVNSLDVSGNITGTAAHFTGAVSGALPTATNHLATKAYVDSAVIAAGGGGGQVSVPFCKATDAVFTAAEVGDHAGADQICAAEFGAGYRTAPPMMYLLTGGYRAGRNGIGSNFIAGGSTCPSSGNMTICHLTSASYGIVMGSCGVVACSSGAKHPVACCNF